MPYNIEVKALGHSSADVIETYENLRNYLQGNFLAVVKVLTSIELPFTAGNEPPNDRNKQWVVSTSRKREMVDAINKLDEVGKQHNVSGTILTLEYLLMACGIEIVDGNVAILSRRKNDELMEKLNTNRMDNNLCDIEISVEGEKFSAHSIVISTLSEYFADKCKDGQTSVEVTDIGKDDFSSILNFLYTGRLLIKHEQFNGLEKAANVMNIECLTKTLEIYKMVQKFRKPGKVKQLSVPLVVVAKTEIPEGFPQPAPEWEQLTAIELVQETPPKKSKPKAAKRKAPSATEDVTIELGRSKRKVKANPRYSDYVFGFGGAEVKQEIVEVTYNSDDEFPHDVASEEEEEEEEEIEEETETFPCDLCNKQFTQKKYLKSHQARHRATKVSKQSATCPLCHKQHANKEEMKEHLQKDHSSVQVEYICGIEECSQTFSSYEDLKQHKDDVHSDTSATLIHEEDEEEQGEVKVIGVLSQNADGKLSVEYKKVLQPRKKAARIHSVPPVFRITKKEQSQYPCKTCVKVFQSAHALAKHEARHSENYRFFCQFCPKKYFDKHHLTKHMMVHDEAYSKEYQCALCSTTFKVIRELEHHVINHMEENELFLDDGEDLGNNLFECGECKKRITSRDKFIMHKILHADQKPFKCVQCGDAFKEADMLRKHIRVVHFEALGEHAKSSWYYEREILSCDECGKKMQRKSLKEHMYTHVTDESLLPPNWKKHKCMFCDKNFRSRGHLERHLRGHTGEKPFMCDICGKSYATADFVQSHINKTHIEAKFFCDVCGKACKTEGALRAHRFVHEDILPHQCEQCGKTFRSKGTLTFHKRLHAFEKPCEICGEKFSEGQMARHVLIHKEDVVTYPCEICQKVFLTRDGQNRHQTTVHSGVRHNCTLCDKSYSSIKILRNHMKLHTGIGLHQCSTCDKQFGTKSMLKKHELIHSGRKDYICKVCGRGFAQPKNRISHERACLLKQKDLQAKGVHDHTPVLMKMQQRDKITHDDDVDAEALITVAANAVAEAQLQEVENSIMQNEGGQMFNQLNDENPEDRIIHESANNVEFNNQSPNYELEINEQDDQSDHSVPFTDQSDPAVPFTDPSDPAVPFTDQSDPAVPFTDPSDPAVPFTDQSDPAIPFTEQSDAAVPFTDQSDPAVPFTDQSDPAVPFTDQSDPAVPFTDPSDPAVPFTDQSDPAVPFTDKSIVYEPETIICENIESEPDDGLGKTDVVEFDDMEYTEGHEIVLTAEDGNSLHEELLRNQNGN